MQVHFVWHHCTRDPRPLSQSWQVEPKRFFWVLATEQEVRDQMRPYLESQWEEFEHRVQLGPKNDDERLRGMFPFMVADDLSCVYLFIRVYPVSGMWNGHSPWKRFGANVERLDELAKLDTSGKLLGTGDRGWEADYWRK